MSQIRIKKKWDYACNQLTRHPLTGRKYKRWTNTCKRWYYKLNENKATK